MNGRISKNSLNARETTSSGVLNKKVTNVTNGRPSNSIPKSKNASNKAELRAQKNAMKAEKAAFKDQKLAEKNALKAQRKIDKDAAKAQKKASKKSAKAQKMARKFEMKTGKMNSSGRKLTTKKLVLNFLLIAFLAVFVVASFNIGQWVYSNLKTKDEYAKLIDEVVKPDGSADAGKIDFQKLKELNPDTVGWIRAEALGIDYPVLQSSDNEYYLDKDFNKQKNVCR